MGVTWMMLLGTAAAALNTRTELIAGMQAAANHAVAGLGTHLLFAALLWLVSISAINFYRASLTLQSALASFCHLRFTIKNRLLRIAATTAASTSFALLSAGPFIERFGDLLSVLLYLLTPWTAIKLVDFYGVRRGRYSIREIFNPHGHYRRRNWRGLVAYGFGVFSMVPFFKTQIYMGVIAQSLGGADIAMEVGVATAALTYTLACRSLDIEREFRFVALDEIGLEQPRGI